MNKRQKGLAQFLIPCGNAAKLFEVVEEPLHLLAQLVEVCIIVDRLCPIALGRYHWHNVLRDEVRSDAIAVIPFVHNGMRQRRLGRHLRQHGFKDGTLMTVPCREDYGDAGAFIATAGMDFGGPTAPRAAQSLCGVSTVFFNAPAAC
jgi:hypothetical protein